MKQVVAGTGSTRSAGNGRSVVRTLGAFVGSRPIDWRRCWRVLVYFAPFVINEA